MVDHTVFGFTAAGDVSIKRLTNNRQIFSLPKGGPIESIAGEDHDSLFTVVKTFAGTADAVVNSSDNEIKILDFKQSNKPKKREYSVINEYGLQLALYSIAHDNMFGTNIKSTEILMCTPNLIFQKFEFKDQEFEKLKKEAMNRVEQYYNLKRENLEL